MTETARMNDIDYNKMLKDLETSDRRQKYLANIRRKWMKESKKYQENIEHMKEFREETYQKKNKDLQTKLKKKEKLYLTSLEQNQKTKMEERQKAIEAMAEKEKLARENVEKFLEKQEKDRQKFQSDNIDKSK